MSWDGIYGHDEVRQRFKSAVERDRLASTFLFVGPEGIGKRKFALQLAKTLLCTNAVNFLSCDRCPSCKQVQAGDHPDLEIVQRLPDRNQIMLEQLIGDKSHREGLCQKIAMKPYFGKRKVAILDDADDLRQEGANALLKTLEEPPPGSIIILIGTAVQRQLPTIRSRSQLVRFQRLPWKRVEQILLEQDLISPPDQAERLARLSNGSVQAALDLFGEGILEFRGQLLQQLATRNLTGNDFPKTVSSFVDQAGKDASARRRRTIMVAHWAADFYRHLAISHCSARVILDDLDESADEEMQSAAVQCAQVWEGSADEIAVALDRCLEVESQVLGNAHQATLLDSWLIDLDQIARGRVPALPSLSSHGPLG